MSLFWSRAPGKSSILALRQFLYLYIFDLCLKGAYAGCLPACLLACCCLRFCSLLLLLPLTVLLLPAAASSCCCFLSCCFLLLLLPAAAAAAAAAAAPTGANILTTRRRLARERTGKSHKCMYDFRHKREGDGKHAKM